MVEIEPLLARPKMTWLDDWSEPKKRISENLSSGPQLGVKYVNATLEATS
jgi:hypothetical protein